MHNFLTEDSKVTFLLCGVLKKNTSKQAVKPLSLSEYNTLVQWLMEMNLRPKDLLHGDTFSKASLATHIQEQRLEKLLLRGVQLGFAIEQWQRHDIWLVSRSDADYPTRYKKQLNGHAPPLLFGIGNRSFMQGGGIAIVGSRHADEKSCQFTQDVAKLCAQNALPVVSGYAKGIDQLAMHTALTAGGTAIGIVAENLLQKSLELPTRTALAAQRLLLLSPYSPDAHFMAWAAMARNKLIYAMADYGLVVSAKYPKSGTWSGAHEEIKKSNALPVFVRSEENTPQGNKKLLELGAKAWPDIDSTQALVKQLQKALLHKPSQNAGGC